MDYSLPELEDLHLDEEQLTFMKELYQVENTASRPATKRRLLSLFSGGGGMDLGFEGGFSVHRACVNELFYANWLAEPVPGKADWVRLPTTSFETVFANDIEPAAARAWRYYFAKRHSVEGRYQTRSVVDLVKDHEAGKFEFPAKIDIVTGGFPCNDFSVAGKRNGFDSHRSHTGELRSGEEASAESRGKLYWWMKQVVEITKPKVFVAENVKGLVSLANVKKIIEDDFRHISGGYLVVPAQVLFAPDYGVPQTRERVIFIGLRKDQLKPEALEALSLPVVASDYSLYPPATHAIVTTKLLKKYVPVGQVFADLVEPELAQDLSQKTFSQAKFMGTHCQGQKEVDLTQLAPTIRAEHHGNIEYRRLSAEHGGKHHDELAKGLPERRLTVRECARVQTFPDDYDFVINKVEPDRVTWSDDNLMGSSRANYLNSTAGYRIIGNAVPPLLAYHIAHRLEVLWDRLFIEE